MTNADDFATHAVSIAKLASTVAMDYFRRPLSVEFKSDDSPVTQADMAVETAVRQYLSQHFPEHGVYGEEHGAVGLESEHVWIIDPIDGTRSFLSGHPMFGFLLALLKDGSPQIGLVAMPAMEEVFIGVKGKGATLNGAPITTSQTTRLDQAILYINEGDKIFEHHPQLFDRLMQSGQTRRFAYDCYPHALLASGHVDAVIDFDLQPYDFMAVSTMIESAGGIMTDWSGNALTLTSAGCMISASTPNLLQDLLSLVSS